MIPAPTTEAIRASLKAQAEADQRARFAAALKKAIAAEEQA